MMLERMAAVLRRARMDGGMTDEAVAHRVLVEMAAPDKAMTEAANEAVYQTGEPPAPVEVVWRAMIASILAGETETE